MGWLRELMTATEPSIQSFGKLAGACLDHPAWPAGVQPKERSLSTLFSKLDRGKDLDWLRDRIEVQLVLADLLKRPLADVRMALGQTPSDTDARFLRLSDVRYARELDLAKEDLPPGIPADVLSPPLWQPTFWRAPSGSGRSLVASWLRARGLSHSATISTREELLKVPPRGALFLEIESQPGSPRFEVNDEDLRQLRGANRPLCIASTIAPVSHSLKRIESPPPEEYLPELIDWVEARLDGSGHFQADRVEQWMRKVALPAGAARTLGDALGLLGMADETPPRSLLAKSLDEVGEHFVKRRVRVACEASAVSPRLAEIAYPALKECAARVLIGGRNELLDPHDIDEWTALLSSPDSDEAPDPAWFTQALRGSLGAQISRRDLRRAAKQLPPSAFQLTRTLESAGLLVRDAPSTHRDERGAERTLRPAWLVTLLTARATQDAIRLSPTQWGRVLLSGGRADDIVHALIERAGRDDFSPYFSVLDDYEPAESSLVAALEGAILAAGLSVLDGVDIPDDLVQGLLQCCAHNLILVFKMPEPRFTVVSAKLFNREHFLAALCALCSRARFPLSHLDPMTSESIVLKRHFHTACQRALVASIPGSSRAVELLRLMAGLFEEGQADRCSTLQLVDSIGRASTDLFTRSMSETSLETSIAFVRATGRSEPLFVKRLWQTLEQHSEIERLFHSAEGHRDFWRKAPPETLAKRAQANLTVEWRFLLPHQFSDWFAQVSSPPIPPEAAPFLPMDAVIRHVESNGVTALPRPTLRLLLRKHPARFITALGNLLQKTSPEDLEHLLDSTPPEVTSLVAQGLPATDVLLRMSTDAVDVIQNFLIQACGRRDPDFERCYDRLIAIQAGVGPLRNLS
jgi:hypothetical protein